MLECRVDVSSVRCLLKHDQRRLKKTYPNTPILQGLPLLLDVDDAFSPRIGVEGRESGEVGNAKAPAAAPGAAVVGANATAAAPKAIAAAAAAAEATQLARAATAQSQQPQESGSEAAREAMRHGRVNSEAVCLRISSSVRRGTAGSCASRAEGLPPVPALAALDRSPSQGAGLLSPISLAGRALVPEPMPAAPDQQEPATACDAAGLQSPIEHFTEQFEALAEEMNLQRHLIHEVGASCPSLHLGVVHCF
jgi:hypothetical protein